MKNKHTFYSISQVLGSQLASQLKPLGTLFLKNFIRYKHKFFSFLNVLHFNQSFKTLLLPYISRDSYHHFPQLFRTSFNIQHLAKSKLNWIKCFSRLAFDRMVLQRYRSRCSVASYNYPRPSFYFSHKGGVCVLTYIWEN